MQWNTGKRRDETLILFRMRDYLNTRDDDNVRRAFERLVADVSRETDEMEGRKLAEARGEALRESHVLQASKNRMAAEVRIESHLRADEILARTRR